MDSPDGWERRVVESNGVAIQTYRVGEGDPIVLAHGYTDDARCLARVADDLAADHAVVLYDARGHGGSAAPPDGYGIEDRVADLLGVLDAYGLEDPVLFGHSMGGSTVANFAARHSDRVRGLVLEDPVGTLGPPESTPEERAAGMREQVADWDERGVDDIAAEYEQYPEAVARRIARARVILRPEIAEIVREGFPLGSEVYPRIEAPTLVLKADADPADRAADLALADELQDGRLVHVHGAGHTVFRDRFDAALAELRTFLLRV